ncbi:MAG: hypothetical protein HYS22_05160 [Deltaproteobacteria bacterium]|nr:hypothetical protein [Deltaproteobacteria bacterium]
MGQQFPCLQDRRIQRDDDFPIRLTYVGRTKEGEFHYSRIEPSRTKKSEPSPPYDLYIRVKEGRLTYRLEDKVGIFKNLPICRTAVILPNNILISEQREEGECYSPAVTMVEEGVTLVFGEVSAPENPPTAQCALDPNNPPKRASLFFTDPQCVAVCSSSETPRP